MFHQNDKPQLPAPLAPSDSRTSEPENIFMNFSQPHGVTDADYERMAERNDKLMRGLLESNNYSVTLTNDSAKDGVGYGWYALGMCENIPVKLHGYHLIFESKKGGHKNLGITRMLGAGQYGVIYLSTYSIDNNKIKLKAESKQRVVKVMISNDKPVNSNIRYYMQQHELDFTKINTVINEHTHLKDMEYFHAKNIVTLFDVMQCIIFWRAPGTDLDKLGDDASLVWPFSQQLIFIALFLHQLMLCHASGKIHLDVKPGNVVTDLIIEKKPDGTKKVVNVKTVNLVDWGFAHYANNTVIFTGGSAIFAAPENFAGMPIGYRTDGFPAGKTLWEFMVGKEVFDFLVTRRQCSEYTKSCGMPPKDTFFRNKLSDISHIKLMQYELYHMLAGLNTCLDSRASIDSRLVIVGGLLRDLAQYEKDLDLSRFPWIQACPSRLFQSTNGVRPPSPALPASLGDDFDMASMPCRAAAAPRR